MGKWDKPKRTKNGPSGDMTKIENNRLAEIVKEVDAGIDSWMRIGKLLAEIDASCLYRATHKSFNDFCRDKWGMSSRNAKRYIVGSRYAEHYGDKMLKWVQKAPNGSTLLPKFTGERAVRPLNAVPDKKIDTVSKLLVEASAYSPLTERVVQSAVDEVCPPELSDEPCERVKCKACGGRGWIRQETS